MKLEMKDIMREEFRNMFANELENAVKVEVANSLGNIIPPIRDDINGLTGNRSYRSNTSTMYRTLSNRKS